VARVQPGTGGMLGTNGAADGNGGARLERLPAGIFCCAAISATATTIRRCGLMRRREGRRLSFFDGLGVSSIYDNVIAAVIG
jgi:hypothetical protein